MGIIIRMNRKLTLSIQASLINKIKVYAAKTGQNISDIVENYFQILVNDLEDTDLNPTGKVAEMAGAFKHIKTNGDYKKEIRIAIEKKYGKK